MNLPLLVGFVMFVVWSVFMFRELRAWNKAIDADVRSHYRRKKPYPGCTCYECERLART